MIRDNLSHIRSMDVVGLNSSAFRGIGRKRLGNVGLRFSRFCPHHLLHHFQTRDVRSHMPALRWRLSSSNKQRWVEKQTLLADAFKGSSFGNPTMKCLSDLPGQTLTEEVVGDDPFDVVILSNGPGEVATWVKSVVEALQAHFRGMQVSPRISVVLAPCPHASGGELELVNSYKDVDRCQGPEWFWKLLLLGSTKDGWNWYKRGVCIFLGGDQMYALLLGLRLGYKAIIYAEDAVRWPGLAHMYMLRSKELLRQVPNWAHSSCKVVGDLFSDAVSRTQLSLELKVGWSDLSVHPFEQEDHLIPVVGLLPGSKGPKLALGVPYFLAVAAHLHEHMEGRVRFVLPLAPTATLSMLAAHADAERNPFISQLQWASGSVVLASNKPTDKVFHKEITLQEGKIGYLVASNGVQIEIWQQFPTYHVFKLCTLCLTTMGTNTAELGLLGIPMLVVLPTHALEVFKGGTGGALGVLANAPGWLGNWIAQAVNLSLLKSAGYIAWPNRWAGEEVVPELVGRIEPTEVAAIAAHYLKSEDKLKMIQKRLFDCNRSPRNFPSSEKVCGAAEAIADEVGKLLISCIA